MEYLSRIIERDQDALARALDALAQAEESLAAFRRRTPPTPDEALPFTPRRDPTFEGELRRAASAPEPAEPKPRPRFSSRPQRPWAYRPPTTSGGGFHQAHSAWHAGSYRTRDRGVRSFEYDTPEVDE